MDKLAASRGSDIDTDKCVENVGANRFDLVLIASARAREIKRQHTMSERRAHVFPVLTALEEVQQGKIGKEYLNKVK